VRWIAQNIVPPSQHRASAATGPKANKIDDDFLCFSCFTYCPPNQTQEVSIMQTAHISALEAKHAVLDRRISEEEHRPLPDAIRLADLKKQKLRVKEEIILAH
jgi:hypothetical protein